MDGEIFPFERLGQALVWLREREGVTQAKLADNAGISAPHLSRIEAGHVLPALATLGKLLAALDADLTALAVANRAVEKASSGAFVAPEHLPLKEQGALLLSAAGFHDFLASASARLGRGESPSG